MKGGIKTKAGKNRIVPIHPKIRPLIERRLAEGGPRLISYNGKVCNQTQYRIFWADIMKALKLNHTPHEHREPGAQRPRRKAQSISIKADRRVLSWPASDWE